MKESKFDFDDILIVPKIFTNIESRYKNIELPKNLPLFTAPMDTVVDLSNMDKFIKHGVNVTLPRTINYDQFRDSNDYNSNVFFSVGFADIEKHLQNKLRKFDVHANILIDVANGHMSQIVKYAKKIKALRPDIKIMVGNIANPETYAWYAEQNCVDYIRVGIGNGGGCLTTKQSGVGYPMASLIHEVYLEKQKIIESQAINIRMYNDEHPIDIIPAIVADGGMKDYSDIIKALALGADYVMIGSIFNKTIESCANNYLYNIKLTNSLAKYFFSKGYPVKKHFRGMSTKSAQKAMGKNTFKTSEGVVRFRKVEYTLKGWTENFEHYLRNAMSYSDATSLDDFIGKAIICKISKSAYDRFNK